MQIDVDCLKMICDNKACKSQTFFLVDEEQINENSTKIIIFRKAIKRGKNISKNGK